MKWQPGFSRILAAVIVSVAVLLGAMMAAPGTMATTATPGDQTRPLDWQVIELPTEPEPVPATNPVPPPVSKSTDAEPTEKPALPALESFRPTPPVATPVQLAAKIEALEVRVSVLENSRPQSTTPPPIIATPAPAVRSTIVTAPRTVCANGVCRVIPAQQPRVVSPRPWRLFRR